MGKVIINQGKTNTLVITIPAKGDVDWAAQIRQAFQDICDHDHTGGIKGKKITGDALADNTITINNIDLSSVNLNTFLDIQDGTTIPSGSILMWSEENQEWYPTGGQNMGTASNVYVITNDTDLNGYDPTPGDILYVDRQGQSNPFDNGVVGAADFNFYNKNLDGVYIISKEPLVMNQMDRCKLISSTEVTIKGIVNRSEILSSTMYIYSRIDKSKVSSSSGSMNIYAGAHIQNSEIFGYTLGIHTPPSGLYSSSAFGSGTVGHFHSLSANNNNFVFEESGQLYLAQGYRDLGDGRSDDTDSRIYINGSWKSFLPEGTSTQQIPQWNYTDKKWDLIDKPFINTNSGDWINTHLTSIGKTNGLTQWGPVRTSFIADRWYNQSLTTYDNQGDNGAPTAANLIWQNHFSRDILRGEIVSIQELYWDTLGGWGSAQVQLLIYTNLAQTKYRRVTIYLGATIHGDIGIKTPEEMLDYLGAPLRTITGATLTSDTYYQPTLTRNDTETLQSSITFATYEYGSDQVDGSIYKFKNAFYPENTRIYIPSNSNPTFNVTYYTPHYDQYTFEKDNIVNHHGISLINQFTTDTCKFFPFGGKIYVDSGANRMGTSQTTRTRLSLSVYRLSSWDISIEED